MRKTSSVAKLSRIIFFADSSFLFIFRDNTRILISVSPRILSPSGPLADLSTSWDSHSGGIIVRIVLCNKGRMISHLLI